MWCWWWWWFSDTIFSPKTFACRTCQSIFDSWVHLAATMRTTGDLMANPAWPTLHGKRLRLAQEWCSGNDVNRKVLPLKPCMKLVGWLYTQCLHTEAPWHIFFFYTQHTFMHGKLDHAQKTFAQTLLQNNVLHMDAFIHKGFDKQEPLSHTHQCLCTQTFWYTEAFAHKNWHRANLHTHTHKCFYTENFCTHNSSTFRKLLHAKALTHRKRSHSDGFLNTNSFYTQKFLHTHIFYT